MMECTRVRSQSGESSTASDIDPPGLSNQRLGRIIIDVFDESNWRSRCGTWLAKRVGGPLHALRRRIRAIMRVARTAAGQQAGSQKQNVLT